MELALSFQHPNITMSDIESHMDLSWDWSTCGVSYNPNLTMAMIETYSNKDWNWSGNGCISINIINILVLSEILILLWIFLDNMLINHGISTL